MEAPEGNGGPGGKPAPRTSTPKETQPPPGRPHPTDSATSLDSDSSGEDWLIKICCPKARHRYRRYAQAKKPPKPAFSDLDKEEDLVALTEWIPTPYQVYPGVPRQESTDLEWLIRLRCPRAQMEQMRAERKQSLPAVSTPLTRTLSKTGRSIQPGEPKDSENWLKHFSIAQAIINERQDVVGSTQALLENENCFVREVDRYLKHSDFLALRRREMLYKKWFENVSSPLLQKIQDKVDKQSSEEIEERKRKQLALYLDYCNKKAVKDNISKTLNVLQSVHNKLQLLLLLCEMALLLARGKLQPLTQGSAFLESYNTSSYDPFFLTCSTDTFKVSVPPLYDPLLKEIRGRYLEAGIIQQCDTGKVFSSKEMNELQKGDLPLLPLSRQLMNPIEWLKIPEGYIESEIRQKSRKAHLRARQGKEQARTQKKKPILASRGTSPTRKARSPERNLLPNLEHGLVLA